MAPISPPSVALGPSLLDAVWRRPPGPQLAAHGIPGDAAAARALINLAYRWHIEGKRLMPAPGKAHWLQRRDPKLYDRTTDLLAEQRSMMAASVSCSPW